MMGIKVVQCNIEEFAYYDKLVSYFKSTDADVITLQEVTVGKRKESSVSNALEQLSQEIGYTYVFAPKFRVVGMDGEPAFRGNALLTKHTLVTHSIHYIPSLGQPAESARELMGLTKDPKSTLEERQKIRAAQQSMPSNFLEATIRIHGIKCCVITSHFPATNRCQEAEVTHLHADFLLEILKEKNDVPIIFAGDLNIEADSLSVQKILQKLNDTASEKSGTLSKNLHPGFRLDPTFPPNGYHVDHVFYTGCKGLSRKVEQVDISDHYPVVCEFAL